jgi:hypothetical protein
MIPIPGLLVGESFTWPHGMTRMRRQRNQRANTSQESKVADEITVPELQVQIVIHGVFFRAQVAHISILVIDD